MSYATTRPTIEQARPPATPGMFPSRDVVACGRVKTVATAQSHERGIVIRLDDAAGYLAEVHLSVERLRDLLREAECCVMAAAAAG